MIAKPKNKITAGKKSPKIPKEISFSPKLFTKILLGVVIFLLPFGLLALLKEIKVGSYSFAFQTGYVNSQSAGEIAKKFIGEQIIGGEVKVTKVIDEGSLYSFDLEIPNQGNFTSYITKDGRFIFPGGYDLKQFAQSEENTTAASQSAEIPKSDQPSAQLFLMSFCPYGNQAEEIMMPVAELLKNSMNIEPHYIVSKVGDEYQSLHGEQELNQDVRELCVYKYQPEKFWAFLKQINQDCTAEDADTCWKGAASKIGININQISNCEKNEKNALLDAEIALTEKYGVGGSPTLLINEATYQGSRSEEAYKQAICGAFNQAPQECNTVLGEATDQTTASGGCQ